MTIATIFVLTVGHRYEGGYHVWIVYVQLRIMVYVRLRTTGVESDVICCLWEDRKTNPSAVLPVVIPIVRLRNDGLCPSTPMSVSLPKTVHHHKSHTIPVNVFSHVPFLLCLLRHYTGIGSLFQQYNTDQCITYNNDWKIISNSGVGQNGSYSYAFTHHAKFFFLF